MKRKIQIQITVILTMILLVACTQVSPKSKDTSEESQITETQQQNEKDSVPVSVFGEFTSYTQSGEEITQEIFSQADITMVNIWATFCNPCIEEMPYLGEISKDYQQKGLQVVGIISDVLEPNTVTAEEIITLTGADYTHIVLSEELYNNFLYQIQSIPTTIFVDKNGNWVGDIVVGARSKEDWISIVENVLKEVENNEPK